MKPRLRELLKRAVDDGLTYGWSRAHKHTDRPERETAQAEIEAAIWAEIDEIFVFDTPEAPKCSCRYSP